ncbi:hypothetical protein M9H77_25813 [Catharanthus roseus]|uniref:Uncharacterized protein n=1 Tax=Catharanthus roseus TaxID=4058 RepID=A0ACC0A9S5_CATRO|nr:hypothetical protein M9H77_25813 [Catharanthus roseus]
MLRPSGRRGDDDLDPFMDRTSRVQGRTVIASSVDIVHLTSRLHLPLFLLAYGSAHPPSDPPPAVYDPYLHAPIVRPHIPYRSSAQEPLNEFSGPARKLGAEFFEERKKVKASDWEQTGPTEGGPVDLKLIPSYSDHVAGSWFIEVPIALHGTYKVEPY